MSLDENLVSIITPVYNSALVIADTIHSVQLQTYPNWEHLLIIDEGTADNSEEIINSFSRKDPRVKLLQVKKGRGIGIARNFGFEKAQGRYIAFLDSDDCWLPEKLEKQIHFMKQNSCAISCTAYKKINPQGENLGSLICPPEKISYFDLLKNNQIANLTAMVDVKQTGPLRATFGWNEDFILWLSILKKGFVCHGLQEDLARYRVMPNAKSKFVFHNSATRWNVYRNIENINLPMSIYYFSRYVLSALVKRLNL